MGLWSSKSIPTQRGKTAIVTGANSGIGYETSLELARAGAHVILACRDATRGAEALAAARTACPEGQFELESLDLSSLASVRAFSDRVLARGLTLDLLVNNAGVMMLPRRELSADGFEMQTAANVLGHFALTGLLLPALLRAPKPRVVSVSSLMAWTGGLPKDAAAPIDFVQTPETYNAKKTYGDTKLENLIFMNELAKRYPAITSVAAHPGGTSTNLQRHAYGNIKWMLQSAAMGALPSLRAATDPAVKSGAYFGPVLSGMGPPVHAYQPPQAYQPDVGSRFWAAASAATRVAY